MAFWTVARPYQAVYYDPLGTENVTSAICRELERRPLTPPIDRFDGAGLYAIYYRVMSTIVRLSHRLIRPTSKLS